MYREQLKKAVAETAKSVRSTNGHSAYAELITELVQPRHLTLDVLESFLPVSTVQNGNYVARKMRKGRFRARSMVPGAQHLADVPVYAAQFANFFDRLIAGVTMNVLEIERGELGTLDELKREVRADLFDELVSKLFNMLGTVWSATNTPSNYINATSTGLTATVLDAAMENTIEYSGGIKAIVGTRRSLLNLYGFAAYKEFLLSDATTRVALRMEDVLLERYRTGKISSYNGAPIIEIPQVLEKRLPTINRKLVRDDLVIVVGEDAGKVLLMGDTQTQDHTDMTKQPPDYIYHAWQEWSMFIDRPEAITIIETA